MSKVENYHILSHPITDEVFIGTIRKKESKGLGGGHCVSENKFNRTNEFVAAIISLYENSTWHITRNEDIFHCCVLDEKTLEKHKDKTLKEFFYESNNKSGSGNDLKPSRSKSNLKKMTTAEPNPDTLKEAKND